MEETGIRVADVGPQIARREFVLQLSDGERVAADERFFLVKHAGSSLSRDGWTEEEAEAMAEHKWWSQDDLAGTSAIVWPEGLIAMLGGADG